MTFSLRYYQQEAIEALYEFFQHRAGNPIVDLPTGSGKSVVIGGFCYRAIADYPETRIMVLAHRKELIKQNAEKIAAFLPHTSVGVWSSGLNRFEKGQVTVAGIQSVYKLAAKFAPIDLLLVDECHLIGEEGMYRRLIAELKRYNPYLKVVGFSATPYRLKGGMLTEGKDRIFTDIAYTANTGRLIREGYLAPLVSKAGQTKADLDGLHVRAGDFIPSEMADRMDKWELIDGACREIISYGHDRKSWLLFCSGVAHAQHVAECLQGYGIKAAMVCGETPQAERDAILAAFKAGEIQAVTNADVLTTGFDHPGISLIALLRPTKSVGLYVQMLGRGLRIDSSKANCLVLDYAGNVARFGPIDAITIKRDKHGNAGVSVMPCKECPQCQALLPVMLKTCDQCGYLFPVNDKPRHGDEADDAPLVAALIPPRRLKVTNIRYFRQERTGKQAGKPPMVRVTYWCGIETINQFLSIEDPRPHVRKHAVKWFWARGATCPATVDEAMQIIDNLPKPIEISVRREGPYWNVFNETFDREEAYALMTRGA